MNGRREIVLAKLDVAIDVMSAWRGRYEDDEWPVTLWWVSSVCPPITPSKLCGVLFVRDMVDVQGIGYARINGRTVLRSRCGSLQAIQERGGIVTRRQFRSAASASGVSLPSRHATLYLAENPLPSPTLSEAAT